MKFINEIINGIKPLYLVTGILAVVLVILVIVLCITAAKRRNSNNDQQNSEKHGIRCSFGELKDVVIPLYVGQDIIIGSDRGKCNYVTYEEGIEDVHCRIRYTGNEYYEVTNQSREGILIDGKRVVSGKGMQLSSGKKIILASKYVIELL